MSTIITVVPVNPVFEKGRRYLTLPFEIDGKKITMRLYDDRMKAKKELTNIKIGDIEMTKEQALDYLDELLAQDTITEEDELISEGIQKALSVTKKPWSIWTESRFIGKDKSLVAWLQAHNFEDGTEGLKGELLLCGIKESVNNEGRKTTTADTRTTTQKWYVTSKSTIDRGFPVLEFVSAVLKEKVNG